MKRIRFAALFLAAFLISNIGYSQGRGGGGSTFGGAGGGMGGRGATGFGSSGMGTGGFGGGGFGGTGMSSGLGGSGFGGSGFGGGGMGGGFGRGGAGQGGFGAMGGMMPQGMGDNLSFVGTDSQDVRQIFQQMGRNSDRMVSEMERANNRRSNRDRQNTQNSVPPPVRIQLRVAFEAPTVAAGAVPTAVTARLAKVAEMRGLPVPEATYENGVVTLMGAAPSASDRLVMEKLVSLEPGVTQVVNQMTVAESIVAPTPQE